MSILTKAALDTLLLANKCTEAEFRTQRICTRHGEATGYVAYTTHKGQRITLGVWGSLNQHSIERIEEIIEERIATAAALLTRAKGATV
jgi:hypothetical protein